MSAVWYCFVAGLVVGVLAPAGCGAKVEPPAPAPKPEPLSAPSPSPKGAPPDAPPDAPPTPPAPTVDLEPPRAVPVVLADRSRVADAEKNGATVVEVQNGGFEVRIEAHTDPEPILALLRDTKCIVVLSIEGDKLTDVALRYAGGFEYLEQLTLHRCPNVSGTGFEALTKLARVKAIALSECPITDGACTHIGGIHSLEELRFLRTKVTDAGLRHCAALPALEALALDGSPVAGTAFAVAGWPKLRDLDAPNTAFTDAGFEAAAGLPALQHLRADSCTVTDAGLRHLSRATKLAELSLSGTKITDGGLAALKALDGLRALDVSNTAVEGSGFGPFAARPNLRKLNLSGTKFDDAGAAQLVKFPGLTNLALADTRVSDAGLVALKGMKKLAKCDLSGTGAGDETAKLLGALADLDDANFARTKLTDAGAMALAAGTQIRQIDARETNVTPDGAARAKRGRTRLEIVVISD